MFGIPDEEWGEQVKAAVELAAGYEPSADLEADLLGFAAVSSVPRGELERRLANLALVARVVDVAIRHGARK